MKIGTNRISNVSSFLITDAEPHAGVMIPTIGHYYFTGIVIHIVTPSGNTVEEDIGITHRVVKFKQI